MSRLDNIEGVYIPKMEMPQICEDCTLESYCGLWVEAKRMCGEDFTDAKPRVRIKATIRHPKCPLIKLPPHGKWIDGGKSVFFPNDDIWACSICDRHYFMKHKFCPHCGAKMESEELYGKET